MTLSGGSLAALAQTSTAAQSRALSWSWTMSETLGMCVENTTIQLSYPEPAKNVITVPNSVQNYCKTSQQQRGAACCVACVMMTMTKTANDISLLGPSS